MSKDERQAIADALRAHQTEAHRSNQPWAVAGSAATALLLAVMERNAVPARWLLAWLAAIAAVLALRLLLGALYRRRAQDDADVSRWLFAYRINIFAHGLVWGLASTFPIAEGDVLHRAIVIVVLMAFTANSLMLTAFDLTAGVCFGAPAIGMLSWGLLARAEDNLLPLGLASLGALLFLSLTVRRSHSLVRNYFALRATEAAQAAALRASEELLERTGATAGVGGWELELATMSLRLTAQAYLIHDVEPIARPTFEGFVELYAPAQQEAIRQGLSDAVLNGVPYDSELPVVTARGRHRWVRLIGRPQSVDGTVVRISGVVQDVTQTKVAESALAEQHHLLDLLVQTTREGFWFIDPQGITTDVNPSMCAILGRPREEIVGRSLLDFVDATNAEVFRAGLAERDRGVASGYEVALQRPDGSQIACYNNATPIFDTAGRRIGSVGMFTDMSERNRAEARMRATSEELQQKTLDLQLTLDSITQGIVGLDAAGRTRVYNRRAVELLDLPEAMLAAGATHDELIRFQVARGDRAPDGSFVDAEGERRHFENGRTDPPDVYVRRASSGALIEVRTRLLPGGGLVRTLADVTAYLDAQQALRDSEAEVRALLDAFPGYIAAFDAEQRYVYVNRRAEALLGYAGGEIVGRPLHDVHGEAQRERILANTSRARSEGPVTVEIEFEATSFRPHTSLQVTYAVGADGGAGRANCYAFGIDITARKAAERGVIAARDEAERANRAKSQFLSSMSHELRTPMNAILGFGQLLVSDPTHPLAAPQRAHVREILRGARHLLTLINEVLDLAQVETGKLRISLEPVAVVPLIEACMGLLGPLARDGGIELSFGAANASAGFVLADRTRLKQVLLNLLSNAIKYNPRGGRADISWSADVTSMRIEIRDSGPGLDAGQRARLFQPFERLDAAQSAVEGAGLGLALSRGLVHAMGGEIGLDSEAGGGSTFWLRLPLASLPGEAADTELAPLPGGDLRASDARPRKVLYIEDNPVNVLLMEAMLARLPNLNLLCAPLPTVGLRMAADEQPDLILLDIQLPEMDGFEALRRLRLDPLCRSIPVIAVSANAMPADIREGLDAGFVRYLTKPLDIGVLLVAVEASLASV